jgi:hypothetical protein
MYRKMGSLIVAAVLALVFASSAAAASFEAHGSVEQVYATGLPADASTSLLDSSGTAIATRNANDLGGILFRYVQRGDGYKVRLNTTNETSGPLTVLTTQSAPPDTSLYGQTIPSDGYGYMTTRDGTKLAYSVHPPTDVLNQLGGNLPSLPITNPVPAPTLVETRATVRSRRAGEASRPSPTMGRWSTSTCGAPAAPAAPSTSSSRCRTSTGTTSSRRSLTSRGSPTTRSG